MLYNWCKMASGSLETAFLSVRGSALTYDARTCTTDMLWLERLCFWHPDLTGCWACRQAENIMIESEENKEYLPIQGLEAFNQATAQLLLGEGHPAIKEVWDLGSTEYRNRGWMAGQAPSSFPCSCCWARATP